MSSLLCVPFQASCEDKEKKLQKELVKGPKDVAATQEKLRQAKDSVQLADAEGELASFHTQQSSFSGRSSRWTE